MLRNYKILLEVSLNTIAEELNQQVIKPKKVRVLLKKKTKQQMIINGVVLCL